MRVALVCAVCLAAGVSHARVFSFQNNWVAAYFRGTGAFSAAGDDAYAISSGSATEFGDKVKYNIGGEIGFMFLIHKTTSVRLGVEAFQTKNIRATGTDAAGDELMEVDSRVMVLNPNLTMEFSFYNTDVSKAFFFAGVGYSTVKMTNNYSLTAAGQTEYPTAEDGKESGEASVISSQYGLGYELYIMDNVTLALEAGYRYLPVGKFKARADSNGPVGAIAKGDTLVDNDGNSRGIDMGGPFFGLSFRFYIPPLD